MFQIKEGWEPLCKFLDLPVPDVPFPHVNESTSYGGRVEFVFNLLALFTLSILLGVSGLIFATSLLFPEMYLAEASFVFGLGSFFFFLYLVFVNNRK